MLIALHYYPGQCALIIQSQLNSTTTTTTTTVSVLVDVNGRLVGVGHVAVHVVRISTTRSQQLPRTPTASGKQSKVLYKIDSLSMLVLRQCQYSKHISVSSQWHPIKEPFEMVPVRGSMLSRLVRTDVT